MPWVRSEYAGELAVLSAWVSALVPMHVVYQPGAPVSSTVIFLRFALFELQFRAPTVIPFRNNTTGEVIREISAANALAEVYPGSQLVGDFFLATPVAAVNFYSESTGQLWQASLLWSLAAAVFLAALVLSIALYLREDAVSERLPLNEVRLMGLLLAVVAATMGVSTVLYALSGGFAGIPIPIGVLVIGALSVVLLRTAKRDREELVEDESDEEVEEPTGEPGDDEKSDGERSDDEPDDGRETESNGGHDAESDDGHDAESDDDAEL